MYEKREIDLISPVGMAKIRSARKARRDPMMNQPKWTNCERRSSR
jgi:hypothetical protein